jgi:two-component system chemotaxis response regulator CheY
MDRITRNAEERLTEDVEGIRKTKSATRCIHFRFSSLGDEDAMRVDDAIDAIERQLDDPEARLYICDDGDVFAVVRMMNGRIFNALVASLTPVLPLPVLERGLAVLFDLTVEYRVVLAICEQKIDTKKNAEARLRAEEKAAKERDRRAALQSVMAKSTTPELMQTLAERRKGREKITVMIADDDLFSRRMVGNSLKPTFEIHEAEDGIDSVLSYLFRAPDILFLDIDMPDMNGHEVLEKIFALDPSAFVVMLSGHGNRENILKAVTLGAKGFVGKPFTREKLLHYIHQSPSFQNKGDATHVRH